jgi:hypothetical protein
MLCQPARESLQKSLLILYCLHQVS